MNTPATKRKAGALTLIEVLVVVAVVAVLGAAILVALSRVRMRSSKIGCINNLKQVGLSFRMWANDYDDKFPMQISVTNGGTMELVPSGLVFPHFQVMSNELNAPRVLVCPDDQTRRAATNFTLDFEDAHISYFVGVDATSNQPAMLLSGDRQIMLDRVLLSPGLHSLSTNQDLGWPKQIHWYKDSRNTGNIVLADGSAYRVDAKGLRELLQKSAVPNRLAIP